MQNLANAIHKILIAIRNNQKRIVAVALACFALACTASQSSCDRGTVLANRQVICSAIKRSPHYSGGKLDKAGFKELHKWVRETNFTLDELRCPFPLKAG